MSDRQLSLHRSAHAGYVKRVNERTYGTAMQDAPLEEVIEFAIMAGDPVLLDDARQIWNHNFFWQSMRPGGGGEPRANGFPYAEFRKTFIAHAASVFGSGWVWLTRHLDDRLAVQPTKDSYFPEGQPLLCLDLWEHAYYIDLPNGRKQFVEVFLDHLLNWEFVAQNMRSRTWPA